MDIRVFDYTDYRRFLADYYAEKKRNQPTYSHRAFATRAGLGSPSHFSMIVKGTRNLSSKTIPKFSQALGLNEKERRYFELLVQYNQSEDLKTKAALFSEMLKIGAQTPLNRVTRDKYEFLARWYMVAIYVLVDTREFRADGAWIANRLRDRITSAQANEAIRLLLDLGLVEQDEVRGLRQSQGAISIDDDTRSIAVFRYHESMIKLALESLQQEALEAREMNGVTLAIPNDKLPVLKERIRQFRKEMNELASSFEHAEDVFQLNIQLFRLTGDDE